MPSYWFRTPSNGVVNIDLGRPLTTKQWKRIQDELLSTAHPGLSEAEVRDLLINIASRKEA